MINKSAVKNHNSGLAKSVNPQCVALSIGNDGQKLYIISRHAYIMGGLIDKVDAKTLAPVHRVAGHNLSFTSLSA